MYEFAYISYKFVRMLVALGANDKNRDDLIRALRRYCRKRDISFALDTKKGKGSHYRVIVGDRWTIVQSALTPSRIRRILDQLGIDSADI